MPKLFRVEVTVELMVVADDASQAERQGISDARYELDVSTAHAIEVTSLHEVPACWHNALPYGRGPSEEDRTIRALLEPG